MKKFLQLFLFLILILISWYSYFNYFKVEKVNNVKISDKKEISSEENSKNFIKNLKYEIKFENNAEYTLNAENSEIIIKSLLILSFCISNQGYQKLKNFLYDF